MRCNRLKTRGSAIILVAGVLAALVLIGSAFLLSTVSEKKVALAHRKAVAMEPVVDSILSMVRERLAEDLFIGANGPYDADPNWQAFVDYPSPDPNYDPNYDRHLASIELALADGDATDPNRLRQGRWPKLTDLVGLSNPSACRNQDPNWPELRDPTSGTVLNLLDVDANGTLDPLPLVDTDGDRVNDAFLFPMGTYDEEGN